MVSPQNPPLWTVNFAVSFLFFSRFVTINCNPTYSQSGCFLLRICVRVICSTASTILLLARRPADISTILHSCCFRYLTSSLCVDLVACISFAFNPILHATCFLNFGLPPSILLNILIYTRSIRTLCILLYWFAGSSMKYNSSILLRSRRSYVTLLVASDILLQNLWLHNQRCNSHLVAKE